MPPFDYTLPLDQLPDPLPIEPLTKPFDVTITPPGSKSITCRAYVLAALAKGESKLIRPLRADDTDLLLKALCTLGAEARWEGDDVYIKGVNGRFPRGGSVNLGEGGTPTRFMIACACLAAEPVTVDGSKRMRERPIAEGVEMLRQLGAKIEYVEAEGRLPVLVTPSETFVGGEIEVGQTQSSQFVSGLMLVAAWLPLGLILIYTGRITSRQYVNMTYLLLRQWNVRVLDLASHEHELGGHEIPQTPVHSRWFEVESDASSAIYWWAAALLNPRSKSAIHGLDASSMQPDNLILAFGAHVEPETGCWFVIDKPGERFPPYLCDSERYPDGAIALAVSIAGAGSRLFAGCTRLTGLRTLRVKETDRIAALANELRKVGCEVATGEDWIEITPPASAQSKQGNAVPDDQREEGTDRSTGAAQSGSSSRWSSDRAFTVIETYNDHRMAMAFAVLGLAAPNGQRLAIRNPACVAKSYPTFWKDFAKLYG